MSRKPSRTREVIARLSVVICALSLLAVAVSDAASPCRLPAHGLLIAAPAVVGIVADLIYLCGRNRRGGA